MLKDQRFWVGAIVGVAAGYYLFVMRPAKMGGGRGRKQEGR